MMKNEIGIIITIILFICIHKGYSHSLKETVELALKSNPDILAVKEKAEESKLDAKSTFRSILPDIKIHASYRHVTEKADIEFPEGTPLEDINLDLSTKNTYETGLTANYLLFSGFAQKNMVKVKNQTTEIRNTQLEKTEKKSAFEVIAKYRQIQGILLEIDALKASAKRIELQKKRISSLIEQGMALSLDTLSLSLSQLNNEQEIIAADAKLKTAYQELSILTGEKIITDPEIKINFEKKVSEFDENGIDDLKLIKKQIRILNTSKDITRAGYYPKVGLYGGIRHAKPGVDIVDNEWMTYGLCGVNINWDLFEWGEKRYKLLSQDASLRSVQYQYRITYDRIKNQYDKAVREFEALKKQYKVALKAKNVAEKKMQIVESRYKQGMSSASEFNDSNLELTEAQIRLQRQKTSLAAKKNEIDYFSGKDVNEWRIE